MGFEGESGGNFRFKIKMEENNLTASQKLEREIAKQALAMIRNPPTLDLDDLEAVDDFLYKYDDDGIRETMEEFRQSGIETGLDSEFSRHYEGEAVAAKMSDGSWVGWTYWTGGGKFGEPEAVPWIEDAYYVDCAEEEKMMVVRTFTKK